MATNENGIPLVTEQEFEEHIGNGDQNVQHVTADEKTSWNAASGVLAVNAHKTNPVLDHPDASVTTEKLADESITIEKIDGETRALIEKGAHQEVNFYIEKVNDAIDYSENVSVFASVIEDADVEGTGGQGGGSAYTAHVYMVTGGAHKINTTDAIHNLTLYLHIDFAQIYGRDDAIYVYNASGSDAYIRIMLSSGAAYSMYPIYASKWLCFRYDSISETWFVVQTPYIVLCDSIEHRAGKKVRFPLLTEDKWIGSAAFLNASEVASVSSVAQKADKAVPTAADNVALLDASGNLADSGASLSSKWDKTAVDYEDIDDIEDMGVYRVVQHEVAENALNEVIAEETIETVLLHFQAEDTHNHTTTLHQVHFTEAGMFERTKYEGQSWGSWTAATAAVTSVMQSALAGKADKAVPTAAGNIALLDANGNLVDSETALSGIGGGQTSDITTLSGTTLSLEDGKVYKLSPTGNTTFTLPSVSDTTRTHQIEIYLVSDTVYTYTFPQDCLYVGALAPYIATGVYRLIFEYEPTAGKWCVGCVAYGAVTV